MTPAILPDIDDVTTVYTKATHTEKLGIFVFGSVKLLIQQLLSFQIPGSFYY